MNILALRRIFQRRLEVSHRLGKLAALRADDAARDGHVGVERVEGGHRLNLLLGLLVFAPHGHHLRAVNQELGRKRVLPQRRVAGLQGLVVALRGYVVVDDVLKVF